MEVYVLDGSVSFERFRTKEFPSGRLYPDRASHIDSPSTSAAAELASDGGLFECPNS